MATRASRRAPNAELPQLNHIESLLIAQGAWEMGTGPSTWPAIAKILSKHPLVTRPKSFFTAQLCHTMYDHLMQEAGLESNEQSSLPQSATNHDLAKIHFQSRREELRELIMAEENAFKVVLKEIEDIKAGKWDAKIKANLTGQALDGGHPVTGAETGAGGDEAFGGSDLSGVTETSSPSLAREGSGTPTLRPNDDAALEATPGPVMEQTPRGPTETNDMEVEEDTGPEEAPLEDSSAVDQPIEVEPADAIAVQTNEKDIQPLRQEEEEEEEETTASKSEEEETDREVGPAKEEDFIEESTETKEHKPEEEEEEEEARESPQEDEDQEAEEVLPEDETNSPPALSEELETFEEPEEQVEEIEERVEEGEEQAEEGEEQGEEGEEQVGEGEEGEEEVASDEEPVQTTRRSTRRKSTVAAPPPSPRKTRRQGRASEPDVQSPAIVEGEHADMDETKTETSQEEDQASSPAPAEPVGIRRSKRKGSGAENIESPRDRKRQRDDSEPVDDDEPGPSSTGQRRRRGDRSEEQVALKRFQNVIGMLHSQISQHRNGNIFHNPIRTVEAPDYHDIVKRPMDLKTIKGRVKDGLIANSLEYQRDIFLMFANAMMYNRPGSDVYHMAEDMLHESEVQIKAFRQTEGLVRGRP